MGKAVCCGSGLRAKDEPDALADLQARLGLRPIPIRQPPGRGELGPTERRRRLHDLDPTFHCSVVGTCFGLGELRRLLAKLGVEVMGAPDHDLHHDAVLIAGQRDLRGKLLSKALEKKFKAAVGRFAAATDADALGRAWDEAAARGDIPEAYWAVLTHPRVTPALMKRVFGEVHMLSHLVGASNRADIRRLEALEREKAEIEARLERQQRHQAQTLEEKDRRIRELEALLARAEVVPAPEPASAALAEALRREASRRAQLERRLDALASRRPAAAEEPRPSPPPEAAEAAPSEPARPRLPELDGATLLLVGGRTAQVPALTRAVAEAGGKLLHHDGGAEMRLGLLPGLVGRADGVVLALDCVSHAAAGAARRLAGKSDKPCLPLRSLSLSALVAAVDQRYIQSDTTSGAGASARGGG